MVDDQTETIRKLKEGLLERDEQIRKVREEALKVQKDLEEQLATETSECQNLQDKFDRLMERKEELKQQVCDLQDELDDAKKSNSVLSNKWKEKSGVIGQLEQQVMQMKTTWENKEKTVTQERDKAVDATRALIEKIKAMDSAFRKQLDGKEKSHQEALRTVISEKQEDIDMANKRVIEVEEEMREMLRETSANKRVLEERIRKLTSVFSELQQGVL